MFDTIFSAKRDRASYWQQIILMMVVSGGIVGVAASMLFSGNLGNSIFFIGAILMVVGLWGRIVMMQRSRDANWPLWLPWALYGASLLATFSSGFSITNFNPTTLLTKMGFSMAVGLADFVVTIALGVVPSSKIASKPSTPNTFDGPPRPTTGSTQPYVPLAESRDGQIEREDAAIARALAEFRARQNGEASPAPTLVPQAFVKGNPVPAPAQIASAPPKPAGFGRKGL